MPAAEELVIDTSVTIAWCIKDEADPYADSVARGLAQMRAFVPSIWPLEVSNALLMAERRKRSTESETAQWTRFLSALPLTIDSPPLSHVFAAILSLGRTHGLTAYDAAYLELAMRRGLPMATLDRDLKSAASKLGVELYQPPKKRKSP
jgi:predicted nucleic acid-binding protein